MLNYFYTSMKGLKKFCKINEIILSSKKKHFVSIPGSKMTKIHRKPYREQVTEGKPKALNHPHVSSLAISIQWMNIWYKQFIPVTVTRLYW